MASRNPYVFVVGCPRSGTTLLQRMLNAHPDLAVTNDTHFITRAVKRLEIGPDSPMSGDLLNRVTSYRRFPRLGLAEEYVQQAAESASTYVEFVSELYDRVAIQEGKTLAGEKTPDYCRSIPFLAKLFPWTYFVHIVRDGRDVALSTMDWAKDGKGPSAWNTWDSSPVGTCAYWWKWQAGTGIRDGRAIPDRYVQVLYSDLVVDPRTTMSRVADRIGLEYREEMIEFARGKTKSNPALSAKSAWLPPTPGLRDWRNQMAPADVELFECIAGDLLDELGFERRFSTFSEHVERMASEVGHESEKLNPKKRPTPPRATLVVPKLDIQQRDSGLSDNDERLIRRDPMLTGLRLVLDGDQLHEQIAPFLDSSIDHVTPVYVRYKPGTNCLVSYQAQAGEKIFWLYAKAHADRELDKLRKAAMKATGPTELGPSTLLLEEYGVVVRLFPLDAKLNTLWRLHHDPVRRVLERLFDETGDFAEVVFEPIRWKPERRLVARMSVRGRNHAAVKFMTGPSFDRTWYFARHRSMVGKIVSPEIVGHSKRLKAVAYEWVDGDVLAEDLRNPEFQFSRLSAVAEMLADLHAGRPKNIPTVRPLETSVELSASADTIQELAPSLGSTARSIARRLSDLIASLPRGQALVHGDFYAKQILVDDARVALLDFDAAASGNRHLDLGNFVAHLHRDALRGRLSRNRAETAERHLVAQYAARVPTFDERSLAAYTAVGLIKLAPHPFRFREDGWFERTREILELAEANLAKAGSTHAPNTPLTSGGSAECQRITTSPFVDKALNREFILPRISALLNRGRGDDLQLVGMQVVRGKPGRRCLIEYRLKSGDEVDSKSVLGKIREKGLDRRTFELTQRLYDGEFGPDSVDGIRVPEPIGSIPEVNMWIQGLVSAIPVSSILESGGRIPFAAKAARALYKLHRLGPQTSRRHDASDELAILEGALSKVSQHHRDWSARLDNVLEQCRHLAGSLDHIPEMPLHRDFYPDQILIDDQGCFLVDLDLYAMGDPALDVGNFVAHLWEYSLRKHGDRRALERYERLFVDTYLDASGFPLSHNISIYAWLSLARHLWISTRIDERNSVTELILDTWEREAPFIRTKRAAAS